MAARKASGHKKPRGGITSSSRDPLDRLPIHKRAFVKKMASGEGLNEAVKAAGVSRRMGQNYQKEADVQAAYRHLVRQAIPAKKLVNLIKGGCEAKVPVYGPDGKKVGERADWKTRKGYIEMASKHGGYYEDKVGLGTGVAISLTVNHIGQPDSGATIHGNRNQRTIEAAAETERAT